MEERGTTIWKRKKKEERRSRSSGRIYFLVVLFFYLIKRRHYRRYLVISSRTPSLFCSIHVHFIPVVSARTKGRRERKKKGEHEKLYAFRDPSRDGITRWSIAKFERRNRVRSSSTFSLSFLWCWAPSYRRHIIFRSNKEDIIEYNATSLFISHESFPPVKLWREISKYNDRIDLLLSIHFIINVTS